MNRQGNNSPPRNSSPDDSMKCTTHKTAAANVSSMLQAAGFGQKTNDPLSERSRRLAKELDEFIERGMQGILASGRKETDAPSEEDATELQIQIARMFRQIFPGNRELLYLVSEKNWMALLLSWMNQYDRPKVQVEAMLSLTTITDLCQQQFYQNPPTGVELSPFSTGLETIHNPFRRSVTTQNKVVRENMSKAMDMKNTLLSGKTGTIAERVKSIMNQAKETSDMLANCKNSEDAQNVASNFFSQSSTQNQQQISKESSSSNDSLSYRSGFLNKPDSDGSASTTAADGSTVVRPKLMNSLALGTPPNINMQPRSGPSGHGPPRPSQNLLGSASASGTTDFMSLIPNIKDGGNNNTESVRKNDPPSLSPAILSALNSSFQNLPPMPPGGSSPIPLVGNYTQPLSVTSNNLLVRHPEAIPSFISLMTSPDKDVCENAMWVVGNIAAGEGAGIPGSGGGGSNTSVLGEIGDKSPSVTVKDIVLAAGAMGPLLRCMERFPSALSLQRIGSWVISTLVETKMPPGKKTSNSNESSRIEDVDLEELLHSLRRLVQTNDDDILSYICWSLSHLCDGPASNITAVVTSPDPSDVPGGLVPRLVELLHHHNWRVTKPALRTIGNIVCAEYDEEITSDRDKTEHSLTDFTEVVLECDAVPRLKLLVNHNNREIQKEACWTLSNIAAGTVDQIQAVIDSGAIPPLVQLVNDESTDQEVRSEACWVVLNATSCGSDQQIGILVAEGCVSVLGLLLEETNMVTMALEGLERVLQVEEARETVWRENQKLNGNSKCCPPAPLVSASLIEKALTKKHKNAVKNRAQKIWNEHFVSCALCNRPYSKHRVSDAKFCQECKCYVCRNCNCEVYHLSYQEELWATAEQTKASKSKKSKNKKKKEKRKEKNKSKAQENKGQDNVVDSQKATQSTAGTNTRIDKNSSSSHSRGTVDGNGNSDTKSVEGKRKESKKGITVEKESNLKPTSPDPFVVSEDEGDIDSEMKEQLDAFTDRNQPPIDFSLYLQQTGSIIALAKLMDALDEGNRIGAQDFDQKSLFLNQELV